MKVCYSDRSRTEAYQRCARLRWNEYHESGIGIVTIKKPLPPCVGSSVHVGIETLLREGQAAFAAWPELFHSLEGTVNLRSLEELAVKAALADFAQYQKQLDVDTTELAAMQPTSTQTLSEQLAASLGVTGAQAGIDLSVETLIEQVAKSRSQFDDYLYAEQCALVEALVRAYARRRLKPLLEQYEVLEVEREGQWTLAQVDHEFDGDPQIDAYDICSRCGIHRRSVGQYCYEVVFMSRPDALLLERESKQLYILSLKTAASWDIRKARDAERDMQGLSEGVEVEKRLARWWTSMHDRGDGGVSQTEDISEATFKFLREQKSPPRIMGIRYEYMLKGDRWTDKDLTLQLGIEVRSQRSHLVRGYFNAGMTSGDEQWNCSWDYLKEGGEKSKLYWKTWRGAPVWEHMPVKLWIDMLESAAESIGEEGRSLGWTCAAQATGFLEAPPLDSVFVPPIIVYRNDDDLRDWMEQVEAQEREVTENVAKVQAATDEGEKRHLLNVYFPQTRKACEYPSTCAFVKLCYGSADIRREPLQSGLYKTRLVNHPVELQNDTQKERT